MKVLYVEDDHRDADLTLRMLARTAPHLAVEAVSTIADAHARLARTDDPEPIDLVLSDMNLRDGNGLSLLNYIRQSSLPVAVVIVTGVGDEDTAVAALKARADDYVVKRTGYLDKLPIVLESAFNHYRAEAAAQIHSKFFASKPIGLTSRALAAIWQYMRIISRSRSLVSLQQRYFLICERTRSVMTWFS
jgi:DNA-binding NtrC family response regulator